MINSEFDIALESLRSLVADNNLYGRLLAQWLGISEDIPHLPEDESATIWTYQEVAAIAIKCALNEKVARSFSDGLSHLMRRRYFIPHAMPGFEADPMAILSVAIGMVSLEHDKNKYNWLLDIINKTLLDESEPIRKSILLFARFLLNHESDIPLIIKAAIGKRYEQTLSKSERESVFKECLTTKKITPEQAIFYLAALEYLISTSANISLESTNKHGLAKMLRSVESALKRWPWESTAKTKKSSKQQWDVQNEYHVQSLLWSLLRPVFPDLQDEEYLKSIGYKHPRVDLAIPSLRVIIEVKYLRDSTQSGLSGLNAEIAEDACLYIENKSNTQFDSLIVFVWDHTASVQHHSTLEDGMRNINAVFDAIVISRPGNWRESDA